MASAVAPLRGMFLPANSKLQPCSQDIVSTILENYGGDTTIDGAPEHWPIDNTLRDGKLLRSLAVDRVALYSPHSSSEVSLVSGDDESMSERQNTYQRVLPLTIRKKEGWSLAEKWEARVQQQKQQEAEDLKVSQEKLMGGKSGDWPLQRRVDSKNVEKGTCFALVFSVVKYKSINF